MSVVHIKPELHFDESLKVAVQLNAGELEQLMSQVISLRANENLLVFQKRKQNFCIKLIKNYR
jgi:hypothetical protein